MSASVHPSGHEAFRNIRVAPSGAPWKQAAPVLADVAWRSWRALLLLGLMSLLSLGARAAANVWFADASSLHKADAASRLVLASWPRAVTQIAADTDGGVWIVTADRARLQHLDEAGLVLADVDLATLTGSVSVRATPSLSSLVIAADPRSAAVWVAYQVPSPQSDNRSDYCWEGTGGSPPRCLTRVLQFGSSGAVLADWTLQSRWTPILSLAADHDGRLWLLSSRAVQLAEPTAGVVAHSFDLASPAVAPLRIVTDSFAPRAVLGIRGAGTAERSLLLQLQATGFEGIDIGEAALPAFDPASGALWLALGSSLSRLPMPHAAGAPTGFQLPPGMGALTALQISRAAAPTLWGAGRTGQQPGVVVLSELGAQLAWLPTTSEVLAISATPMALQPQLDFTEPPEGSATSNPLPSWQLRLGTLCSNEACAMAVERWGPYSLFATLGGVSIATAFVPGPATDLLTFRPSLALADGTHTVVARLGNRFGQESATTLRAITVDTLAPTLLSLSPATGTVLAQPGTPVSGTVNEPATVTIGATVMVGPVFALDNMPLQAGANDFLVSATDAAGNMSSTPVRYWRLTATVTSPSSGATVSTPTVTVSGTVAGPPATAVTVNEQAAPVANGGFSASVPLNIGTNLIRVRAAAGNAVAESSVTVTRAGDGGIPVLSAPPNDPGSATNAFESTRFLYSGANPVQTGVAEGTITAASVAVVRGRVLQRSGQPLPGVTVQVHQRSEFGQTLSRTDGAFDLALNGGGSVTLTFTLAGHLPAQVTTGTDWQAFRVLDDVVLLPLDDQRTVVQLGAGQPVQVAQGSAVTDSRGTRQATVLFPAGVTAEMVLPNGSTQPLGSLTVRATEYTVGPAGPRAMPGTLPPTSGYTYAVELSVDEAMAAGAKTVRFSRAVPVYVENFLGFPVGGEVPVGYYNRDLATWASAPNGRVVKLLNTTGGQASLDINGDGASDSVAELAALGIDDDERTRLATLYAAGQTFWRVRLDHFTPWDCNWPFEPPTDARAPSRPPPFIRRDYCPALQSGSVIECQNQTLGETLPVAGTPFTLNYRSDRVPGRPRNTLDISLTGDQLPASLVRVLLQVEVAGQTFNQSFPANRNQTYTYRWNGLDAYGRATHGTQQARVRIGYAYAGVYQRPGAGTAAFAAPSGVPITGNIAASEVYLWQTHTAPIGDLDARALGLGAWALDAHHRYDAVDGTLYLGSGSRRQNADGGVDVITTIAGTGEPGYTGDGGPATQARIGAPGRLAVDEEGNVIFVDGYGHLRKVSPDGVISTVAPQWQSWMVEYETGSEYRLPNTGLAIGERGQIFVSTRFEHPPNLWPPGGGYAVVDAIDRQGVRTRIAGGGQLLDNDSGPATSVRLWNVNSLAADKLGNVYILDAGSLHDRGLLCRARILRVDRAGNIVRVLGGRCGWLLSGQSFWVGGELPATSAPNSPSGDPNRRHHFGAPDSISLTADGTLYFGTMLSASGAGFGEVFEDYAYKLIVAVEPKGTFRWHGGFRLPLLSRYVDGDFVKNTTLAGTSLAVTPNGEIFIAEAFPDAQIRKVDLNGVVRHVTGGNRGTDIGDGGPAAAGVLLNGGGPLESTGYLSMAVDAAGALYIADSKMNRIRRVGKRLPRYGGGEAIIPASDGTQLYRFSPAGRHLQTLDARTKAVLLAFAYDAAGLLITVTDAGGNVTRIERTAGGEPAAIVSPDGQRTVLALDGNGYLNAVTDAAGHSHRMTYTATGLLTRFQRPSGAASTMSYDAQGRLLSDNDAAGGGWALVHTEQQAEGDRLYEAGNPNYVTQLDRGAKTTSTLTTALGLASEYRSSHLTDGSLLRKTTHPDGTVSTTQERPSGQSQLNQPDGTTVTRTQRAHPRFGSLAPLVSRTERTPAGLQRTESITVSAQLANPGDPLSLVRETTTTAVNGRITAAEFTTATGITQVTTPTGRRLTLTQDPAGRVLRSEWLGVAPVSYEYDSRGRLVATRQGSGADERTTRLRYGPSGYLAEWVDALAQSTTFIHDAVGRPTRQTGPDGQAITFAYDANGNLVGLTPPSRPTHGLGYTVVDLPASYSPPALEGQPQSVTVSYDADRRPTLLVREDAAQLAFGYDAAGRLASLTPTAGTGFTLAWRYGASTGQVQEITGADATLAYAYDGFLPTSEVYSGAVSGTVQRGFDADFRLASLSAAGASASFAYDADSLLIRAGELLFTRDAQHGLPVASALDALRTSQAFTAFGEPALMVAWLDAGPELFSQQLGYDKLGRVVSSVESVLQDAAISRSFEYDAAGRLVRVLSGAAVLASYGYDANGNRTHIDGSLRASFDVQDRLLWQDGAVFSYNASGQLAAVSQGAASTLLRYDIHGSLRSVQLPSGALVEYLTDALHRRVAKKLNGQVLKRWLYQDALRIAAELDAAGSTVASFVHGLRPNVPEYMIKNGQRYRLITDHLGSVRLVVHASTGVVAQRLDYDEWGRVLFDSSPGFQPFGFAGGLYDPDTGLVRFGARDYDAGTGRWTAKDPIGFAGGQANLYSYVEGNPISFVDPDGLCPCGDVVDLTQLARGDKRDWSRAADRSDVNKAFGKDTYKCNLFADEQYENAGYNLPNVGGMPWNKGKYPPGAGQLSDPRFNLSGWPRVGGPAQAGDLVAHGGHVGIATSSRTTISASPSGKIENNWGFRKGQEGVVIRRCSCGG